MNRMVTFFPWLQLRHPLAMGDFEIVPVIRWRPIEGFDDAEKRFIERLLEQYLRINGKAVDHLAVLKVRGKLFVPISGDEEFERQAAQIKFFCQLAAFGSIAENDLFGRNSAHDYANWSVFTPTFNRGPAGEYMSFSFRRKGGNLIDMGYKIEALRFTCPAEARGVRPPMPRPKLVGALAQLLTAAPDKRRDLQATLSLFLESYMDMQTTIHQEEAALGVRAIEVLLKRCCRDIPRSPKRGPKKRGSAHKLADRLATLLGQESLKSLTKQSSRSPIADQAKFMLWNWFVEAYAVRNGLHHDGEAIPQAWGVTEHIPMLAQVYVACFKRVLARIAGYKLDDREEAEPQLFEMILGEQQWYPQTLDEEIDGESGLQRVRRQWDEEQLTRAFRRIWEEEARKAEITSHPAEKDGAATLASA